MRPTRTKFSLSGLVCAAFLLSPCGLLAEGTTGHRTTGVYGNGGKAVKQCTELLDFVKTQTEVEAYENLEKTKKELRDRAAHTQQQVLQKAFGPILDQALMGVEFQSYKIEENDFLWNRGLKDLLIISTMGGGSIAAMVAAILGFVETNEALSAVVGSWLLGALFWHGTPDEIGRNVQRYKLESKGFDWLEERPAHIQCWIYVKSEPTRTYDKDNFLHIRLPFEIRGCKFKYDDKVGRKSEQPQYIRPNLSRQDRRRFNKSGFNFGAAIRGRGSSVGRGVLSFRQASDGEVWASYTLYSGELLEGVEVEGLDLELAKKR